MPLARSADPPIAATLRAVSCRGRSAEQWDRGGSRMDVEFAALIAILAAVIPSLAAAVRAWGAGRVFGKAGRSVVLEIDGERIEVDAADPEEMKHLVDAWLSRVDDLEEATHSATAEPRIADGKASESTAEADLRDEKRPR